jgi:hypothetical protein
VVMRTSVAALAAVGTLGLVPAPAVAADTLPRPGLTGIQVSPSSCPRGEDPLAFSRRPTLTAALAGPADPGRQVRFQVADAFALDLTPAQRKEFGAHLRPVARGTVGPQGGSTYAWRPGADLGSGGSYAWRARVVVDGEPASRWSVWRRFTVAYDGTPAVRECRVGGWRLQSYLGQAEQLGYTLDEMIRAENWISDFWRLTSRLADAHPKAFAGGQPLGDGHSRRGWLVFRGTPPPAALAAVDRFRATHPGSNVRVVLGRSYTSELVFERARAMYERLESSALVHLFGVSPDMRTGTIRVTVIRRHGVGLTRHQVRKAVLADLRTHADGYDVVPAGGGVLASGKVQPVQISVRKD